jgi:hypothetical protein
VNEALSIAPIALANLVHAYDPEPGVLGTRSNLASLTNVSLKDTITQVCGSLGKLTGGLLGVGGLGSLGGNVQTVCDQVGSSAPNSTSGTPTGASGTGLGSITSGMLIGGS